MIKNFKNWLAESISWKDMKFEDTENDVADIAEQELLTKELVIIDEEEKEIFRKLDQISSVNKGKIVLEIHDHILSKYETPFEFLKWEHLGNNEIVLYYDYILKLEDYDKV